MSVGGRFGKYGDAKRKALIRKNRLRPPALENTGRQKPLRGKGRLYKNGNQKGAQVPTTDSERPKARPIHYKIHMEPEIESFRFSGTVQITVGLGGTTESIVLNASELAVWRCVLEPLGQAVECSFRYDPVRETLTIYLPGSNKSTILPVANMSGSTF